MFGYLSYYYNTTNLITKSEGDQRYVANTTVTQALLDSTDEYNDAELVTTVTNSNRKFLSSDMNYTALLFKADMAALEDYELSGCTTAEEKLEYLRGVSKTPATKAAEAGVLEELGTVKLVRNEKTGEIISCEVTPAK